MSPLSPGRSSCARCERTYRSEAGDLPVLRGADLTLHAGEIVALVAPSGTGKSTLLHLAGLLEQPDGGSVYVQGREAGALSDAERTAIRRDTIGFVYQFHHLLAEFSALENVVLPQMIAEGAARRRGSGRWRCSRRSGSRRAPAHLPGKLSGGEQQRVAIARALANDAEGAARRRADRQPRCRHRGGGVRRVAGDGARAGRGGADRDPQPRPSRADGSCGDAPGGEGGRVYLRAGFPAPATLSVTLACVPQFACIQPDGSPVGDFDRATYGGLNLAVVPGLEIGGARRATGRPFAVMVNSPPCSTWSSSSVKPVTAS